LLIRNRLTIQNETDNVALSIASRKVIRAMNYVGGYNLIINCFILREDNAFFVAQIPFYRTNLVASYVYGDYKYDLNVSLDRNVSYVKKNSEHPSRKSKEGLCKITLYIIYQSGFKAEYLSKNYLLKISPL